MIKSVEKALQILSFMSANATRKPIALGIIAGECGLNASTCAHLAARCALRAIWSKYLEGRGIYLALWHIYLLEDGIIATTWWMFRYRLCES